MVAAMVSRAAAISSAVLQVVVMTASLAQATRRTAG
jgi:hypothetical protein